MESPITIRDQPVKKQILAELNLVSMERLDRSSPELWPDQVPGMEKYPVKTTVSARPPQWTADFNVDDVKLLLGLSKHSASGLVQEVKKLYDAAYKVGCDESKEVARGKCLKILIKKDN